MVLNDIDTETFLALPMAFVHGREDIVCKVTSSIVMCEARKELGAADDEEVPEEYRNYPYYNF